MAAEVGGELARPGVLNDPAVEAAFQAVPDTMIAEIIDGQLHTMPHPGRRHTVTSSVLGGVLGGPFWVGKGGPGGWILLDKPELHLGPGPDKLVPDLAGFRRERMPAPIDDDDPPYYDVAPDWVCEILSPSTEVKDRIKKMRIYGREGVGYAWLLHPINRTLEVFRLEGGFWLQIATFEQDDVVRAEPFDAIEIPLKVLFDGPGGL